MLQNNWVTEEIKGGTKSYQRTNENMIYQNLWKTAKAVLRVCSNKGLPQKNKKNLYLEVLENEQMKTKGNKDLVEGRKQEERTVER